VVVVVVVVVVSVVNVVAELQADVEGDMMSFGVSSLPFAESIIAFNYSITACDISLWLIII